MWTCSASDADATSPFAGAGSSADLAAAAAMSSINAWMPAADASSFESTWSGFNDSLSSHILSYRLPRIVKPP